MCLTPCTGSEAKLIPGRMPYLFSQFTEPLVTAPSGTFSNASVFYSQKS